MSTHDNAPPREGWRPEARANPLDPPLTIPPSIVLGEN